MDELQQLYDSLYNDGYVTISFDEFKNLYENKPGYKDKVVSVLERDNKTSYLSSAKPDIEKEFVTLMKEQPTPLGTENISQGEPTKQKPQTPTWSWYKTAAEQQAEIGQQDGGAYRSPLAKPFIPQREQTNIPEVLKPPAVVREEYKEFKQAQQERAFKLQKDIADAEKKSFQESVDENKKWIESNAIAQEDPNFIASLQGITPGLIGNEEKEVVETLTKTLSKYGFTFQPTGIGDALLVRTADGLNEIEIDLDPFLSSTENSESEKLKKFIKANAQPATEYRGEDFISKATRAKTMRDKGMVNDDGSFSTVKFAQYEEDGKFYVVPTLFPKDPFNYGVSKSDWMELPIDDAIRVAKSRGEVFEFNNEKDAKDFSEGAWKDVDAYDVEGEKFYKERGLDYYNEKKKWKEYTNAQDEIELIDKITDNPGAITAKEKERFKKYFSPDGRPLYGDEKLSEFRNTLEETRDNLQGQVFDASFFKSDGTIQKAREDFDFVLAEKQSKLIREAIDVNKKSKTFIDELNEFSLARFNTPIEYIANIVPKTDEDAIDLDVLKQKYVVAKASQKDAAFKFEMGKTYYDAKWNKEATTEYDENISGFFNAVSDAWTNGWAAEAILSATLGIDDIENLEDRQEVARNIAENLSQLSGKQSKIMSRINLAREGEFSKAFFADPFEATATLVVTSLAQMLPLGLTIIPRTVAAGASAGAAIGAAGGAGVGGVGAIPGAIGGTTTGAGIGLKTGIAATSFALEYTNSILDAMRAKGYDLLDPKQVEAALMDDTVWEQGGQIGIARGIPIAVVDGLSTGLAGRVFKVSKLASTPTKIAAQVGERIVYDPLAEGFGEFSAQVSAGQGVNMNEVVMESLGGLGSNTTSMALNMMKDARSNTSIKVAHDLTNIQNVAKENVSDERISQWANNMHQLGKIDADVNQRIQENVGLRREAREVLSVDGTKPKSTKAEARAMELLSAREMLSRTSNLKQINSRKISQINEELAAMGETKDVVAADKQVNLDAILGTTRNGVSYYQLNGKTMTKDKFLETVNSMTDKQLVKAKYKVSNDTDTQTIINNKVNAIQKQSTGAVPVQSEAGVSKTVEEGKPQAEPQVTTQEDFQKEVDAIEERRKKELSNYSEDQLNEIYSVGSKQTIGEFINSKYNKQIADLKPTATVTTEEVTQATDEIVSSKTRLDEIADILPEKVAYTPADLDNFASLEEDKAEGVLSGLADKVASGVELDDKEQIVYDNNKQRVNELSDLASEKIALEESVADLEAMISGSQPAPAETTVQPRVELTDEQIVEYAPTEDVSDKNNDVLLKTLQSKNISPQAEPIVTDFGDTVVFEYNNFDENETRTRLTFKKKADGTIISRGVKVERSTGDIRGSKFFRDYINEQRAKAPKPTTGFELKTKLKPSEVSAFNKGVAQVQKNAEEYRKSIKKKGRVNPPQKTLFNIVSEMMAKAYEKVLNQPNEAKVKESYDAMIAETLQQYDFIVSKGLNVVRHTGKGEPYTNSEAMLKDLRDNNTLKFLPNDEAFGQDVTAVTDNIGLQPSGRKLNDGYEMTNSEVFRVVHDYFGHGILGNQFGAIGEENATLQHLDLYSDIAAPAVIYQTRGQNSWVNFSGENTRANELRKQARELKKQGKEKEANLLLEEADKIFKFAEPKIGIFPNIFNFKRYESARRIKDKQILDNRPNKRNSELPGLLAIYSNRSRKTRGVNKRDIREVKTIRGFALNVIAEYTLDNRIDEGIKKAFPLFKGVQKIYEITDGDKYRQMMFDALKDNDFAASVTIHSAEDFNKMRLFITEDGSTGFTIRDDGFLGGGFSDPNFDRPNNIAQLLIFGIKEGATTAECFDTVLPNLYSRFGLKAVSRTAFNDEYRPMVSNGNTLKDWDYETYKNFNDGRPDVVFLIYDGGDRNTIEDRIGLFDEYTSYEKGNTQSFDKEGYDEAEEVMKQEAVKRLELDFEQEEQAVSTQDVVEVEKEMKKLGKPSKVGLPVSEFLKELANNNISDAAKLIKFLNLSFPSVFISATKEDFDNVMSQIDTTAYVKGDQVIYGVTKDGEIYINPDVHDSQSELFNTAIHEFGHVWTDYLRTTEKGTKIYNKGISLIEEGIKVDKKLKAMFDEQMQKFDGDKARALNEMVAILIGDKGESIANASIKSKFKEFLSGMWNYIKSKFKMSEDLTEDEIQNMNLDTFLGTALADIFSGKEIKLTEAQKETIKNPDAMFHSTQSMNSIISQGRANGFSDAAIKQVLINRGFKASDVNAALAVQVDVFTELPREFANVDGGVVKGMQLFNEVKTALNNWANTAEDMTYGEMRQKAMDLMKANPIFQAQPDTTQMELLSAFDRTLNTRANVNVQRQITQIKNNLRQRKIGANELQQSKIAIKNLIRSVLPKSSTYTQAQINKLITIINNATKDSILADTEKVMAIVEHQREKMKNAVLKDMFELVSKKSKPAMTTTGKRRTGGVDAKGQAFFAAVKPILRAAIKNDINYMSQVANELAQADADGTLNEAILKEQRGETLTIKEQELLNKAYAFDTFADVLSMDLEEVQDLMSTLETERAEAIMRLKTRRQVRAAEYEAMNTQASAQVQELNPELFVEEVDANGNVNVRPKSRNELVQDRASIRRAFQSGKIWSGFKQLVARWDYTTITGIKDFVRKRLLHLGALVDLFDNKAKGFTFFNDNVYRPLNRMDEQSKAGYFTQMQNLDAIANSINGITKGYKQIRSMLQTGVHEFTINGRTDIYNADKLLRIYALSKNAIQREKLKKMGWDDAQIDKIKTIVGPQAIEFTDKLVDYLSNEYYESINTVYSQVNDVNLGYVPNYFPTITESTKVNAKLLEDGDFNGIFNAETAPALKERADTSGLIELNYDFTDVLESHLVSMEKYKAYAEGVRRLNALFQNPSVNILLEESGLKSIVKRSVNFAITPNAGQKEEQTMLGRLMTKFTGFALAFKAIQIVKQATSFINAYEDYNFFPQGSRVPGVVKGPINLLMFMVDSAKVIATMPVQIRNAYNMSANVRDRLEKGIEGDVYGLESGSTVFTPISKSNKLWARAVRALKTGGAAPTVLGDILGVMGYMVNYNRNIANGMTQEAALEAFNNYNATAQSRRGTEKSSIQQNSSELARAFTMFGSTTFLQINKVLQSQKNIFQALTAGKMPESKDIRAFIINLGLANALFVGVSNIAKFMKGDDDDREEALKRMKEALLGLNLIESIPLIGSAVEEAKAYIEDKKGMPTRDVVNPYSQVFKKMKQGLDEGTIWSATRPLIEITIGAQLDPAIGLYNGFTEGFDEDAVYDMIGISKSYRPTQEKEGKQKLDKPMSKEDLKRYYPEMYEQMYGPGGLMSDVEELKKQQMKLKKDALREKKDRMYNYTEMKEDKPKKPKSAWEENKKEGGTVWDNKEKKGSTVWGNK